MIDPLGGSYFLENLTTRFEKEIFRILDQVDELGGAIKLIEDGWFQAQIAETAYETALRKASGEKPVIGVNKYVEEEMPAIELHPHDESTERRQIENLQRIRRDRDNTRVQALLQRLRDVARDDSKNVMPLTIELVKAQATMGDIVEALRDIWGTYQERPVF